MSFVARPGNSPTWADDLPEGWTADWVKWSVAFASTKPTDEDTEKLPYISNEDIASWTGKMLKEAPEPADKEGRVFQRDDVLFNKLRPYLAKVYHADFDGISSGELNRPGFTGGQNSRRIAHHGTESKEDLEAVFT